MVQVNINGNVNCQNSNRIDRGGQANFILSKLRNFTVPYFYIVWKIMKDPFFGKPINYIFERILLQI